MRSRITHAIAALGMGILILQPSLAAFAEERRDIPSFRAYGTPAYADDAMAIGSVIEAFKRTWGNQDTEAFIALHAQDTEWVNAYARIFQDAASLAGFLEHRLFPAFDPVTSEQEAANMKTISIRYLGRDAAVIHLYTDGQRGQSRNQGEEMRRTHLHLVLERRSDGWKIVHTAIMDAR